MAAGFPSGYLYSSLCCGELSQDQDNNSKVSKQQK